MRCGRYLDWPSRRSSRISRSALGPPDLALALLARGDVPVEAGEAILEGQRRYGGARTRPLRPRGPLPGGRVEVGDWCSTWSRRSRQRLFLILGRSSSGRSRPRPGRRASSRRARPRSPLSRTRGGASCPGPSPSRPRLGPAIWKTDLAPPTSLSVDRRSSTSVRFVVPPRPQNGSGQSRSQSSPSSRAPPRPSCASSQPLLSSHHSGNEQCEVETDDDWSVDRTQRRDDLVGVRPLHSCGSWPPDASAAQMNSAAPLARPDQSTAMKRVTQPLYAARRTRASGTARSATPDRPAAA